eukprot:COSAG04_NODE_1599_length_6199_cov_57.855246_5_plen_87_part_00
MLGELIDSTDQNPWRNISLADQLEANKPLARRAARESVVLLRNRQGVLPLSPGDPDSFTRFRPYLAHFFPVFPRFLRVFTVSTRRF